MSLNEQTARQSLPFAQTLGDGGDARRSERHDGGQVDDDHSPAPLNRLQGAQEELAQPPVEAAARDDDETFTGTDGEVTRGGRVRRRSARIGGPGCGLSVVL